MRTKFLAGLCLGLSVPLLAQAEPTVVWKLDGFKGPESVALDRSTKTLYVSNYGADPMKKDGDGFISTITVDGHVTNRDWVSGLNGPKGMDISGSTLYVADIDQLVAIDTATGRISARYPVAGAQFLNDVVAAPDGRIFVSDTFAAAVYVLDHGTVSRFVQDPMLMGANGLIIDGDLLLVADLGDISQGFAKIKPGPVVKVDLATKEMSSYGADGPVGVLDGIELDGSGGVYVTDNPAGKLLDLKPGGTPTELATVGSGAADLEVVPDAGLVLIPVSPENTVVALKVN